MYIRDMSLKFKTDVRIARPVEQVFAFVSDPLEFPRWNSAVRAVERTSERTFLMRRELPAGPAENVLEVFEHDPPARFGVRTTSGPTPFVYRYAFTPDGDGTLLELDAAAELGGAARLLGPLAAQAVKRGVDANFATLKRTLEG
jgi:carbon monoxide dehydrogenase subunit G